MFLASHAGTTLQAIIEACATGELPAQVAVVISNNRDSGALRRAGAVGIPAYHLSSQTSPDPDALDDAIRRALVAHGVDLVVLGMYGSISIGRVLAAGERKTGASVHVVTDEYDAGPSSPGARSLSTWQRIRSKHSRPGSRSANAP